LRFCLIKMKHRVSITLEEDTLLKVKAALRSKGFRNQSHFFELAAEKMVDGGEG
jgi:metal-responsive CopG/Arc/MetJ family transcriptional regulator